MDALSGLDALLKKHHTFVSGTAKRFGISSSMLDQAVKKGKVLPEARGVYVETGYTWDDFEVLSQRYTKGVFALDTALSMVLCRFTMSPTVIFQVSHQSKRPTWD